MTSFETPSSPTNEATAVPIGDARGYSFDAHPATPAPFDWASEGVFAADLDPSAIATTTPEAVQTSPTPVVEAPAKAAEPFDRLRSLADIAKQAKKDPEVAKHFAKMLADDGVSFNELSKLVLGEDAKSSISLTQVEREVIADEILSKAKSLVAKQDHNAKARADRAERKHAEEAERQQLETEKQENESREKADREWRQAEAKAWREKVSDHTEEHDLTRENEQEYEAELRAAIEGEKYALQLANGGEFRLKGDPELNKKLDAEARERALASMESRRPSPVYGSTVDMDEIKGESQARNENTEQRTQSLAAALRSHQSEQFAGEISVGEQSARKAGQKAIKADVLKNVRASEAVRLERERVGAREKLAHTDSVMTATEEATHSNDSQVEDAERQGEYPLARELDSPFDWMHAAQTEPPEARSGDREVTSTLRSWLASDERNVIDHDDAEAGGVHYIDVNFGNEAGSGINEPVTETSPRALGSRYSRMVARANVALANLKTRFEDRSSHKEGNRRRNIVIGVLGGAAVIGATVYFARRGVHIGGGGSHNTQQSLNTATTHMPKGGGGQQGWSAANSLKPQGTTGGSQSWNAANALKPQGNGVGHATSAAAGHATPKSPNAVSHGLNLDARPWENAHKVAPGHEAEAMRKGIDALNKKTGTHFALAPRAGTTQIVDGGRTISPAEQHHLNELLNELAA